jgi:hypothetical protein
MQSLPSPPPQQQYYEYEPTDIVFTSDAISIMETPGGILFQHVMYQVADDIRYIAATCGRMAQKQAVQTLITYVTTTSCLRFLQVHQTSQKAIITYITLSKEELIRNVMPLVHFTKPPRGWTPLQPQEEDEEELEEKEPPPQQRRTTTTTTKHMKDTKDTPVNEEKCTPTSSCNTPQRKQKQQPHPSEASMDYSSVGTCTIINSNNNDLCPPSPPIPRLVVENDHHDLDQESGKSKKVGVVVPHDDVDCYYQDYPGIFPVEFLAAAKVELVVVKAKNKHEDNGTSSATTPTTSDTENNTQKGGDDGTTTNSKYYSELRPCDILWGQSIHLHRPADELFRRIMAVNAPAYHKLDTNTKKHVAEYFVDLFALYDIRFLKQSGPHHYTSPTRSQLVTKICDALRRQSTRYSKARGFQIKNQESSSSVGTAYPQSLTEERKNLLQPTLHSLENETERRVSPSTTTTATTTTSTAGETDTTDTTPKDGNSTTTASITSETDTMDTTPKDNSTTMSSTGEIEIADITPQDGSTTTTSTTSETHTTGTTPKGGSSTFTTSTTTVVLRNKAVRRSTRHRHDGSSRTTTTTTTVGGTTPVVPLRKKTVFRPTWRRRDGQCICCSSRQSRHVGRPSVSVPSIAPGTWEDELSSWLYHPECSSLCRDDEIMYMKGDDGDDDDKEEGAHLQEMLCLIQRRPQPSGTNSTSMSLRQQKRAAVVHARTMTEMYSPSKRTRKGEDYGNQDYQEHHHQHQPKQQQDDEKEPPTTRPCPVTLCFADIPPTDRGM